MKTSPTKKQIKPAVLDTERHIGRIKTHDGTKTGRIVDLKVGIGEKRTLEIKLRRGGTIKIHPNLIDTEECRRLASEVTKDPTKFSEYKIQGAMEPRVNLFLHKKATAENRSGKQPGYRYRVTKMKGLPMWAFDGFEAFSNRMATLCHVDEWDIGANVVIFRDGSDSIGFHADNDQGEQKVCTCLIDSPPKARAIHFRVSPKINGGKKEIGDEFITLWLRDGDAYEMDGEMQVCYEHAVPKDGKQVGTEAMRRISVVFRHGNEVFYEKDTGVSVPNLHPRDVSLKYNIGRTRRLESLPNARALVEGDLYSRTELHEMRAFRGGQRGISGNHEFGCDAIVVSGAREDGLGDDAFTCLHYYAESNVGGGGMVASAKKSNPIRVFRSSAGNSSYRARPSMDKKKRYRYDGLYLITEMDSGGGPITPDQPFSESPNSLYGFRLDRVGKGSSRNIGDDENSWCNEMSNSELLTHCWKTGTMLPAPKGLPGLSKDERCIKRKGLRVPKRVSKEKTDRNSQSAVANIHHTPATNRLGHSGDFDLVMHHADVTSQLFPPDPRMETLLQAVSRIEQGDPGKNRKRPLCVPTRTASQSSGACLEGRPFGYETRPSKKRREACSIVPGCSRQDGATLQPVTSIERQSDQVQNLHQQHARQTRHAFTKHTQPVAAPACNTQTLDQLITTPRVSPMTAVIGTENFQIPRRTFVPPQSHLISLLLLLPPPPPKPRPTIYPYRYGYRGNYRR